MRPRWLLTMLLGVIACGGGSNAIDAAAAQTADAATPTQATGPRLLAATFVDLELDQFPKPAAVACADNLNEIMVAAGESIGAALATATPGTTVWVAPGTYTETTGNSIALRWTADNVCLRASDGGTVVIVAGAGQTSGIAPGGDDAVVQGFTLRGFTAGVVMGNQTRVTIERVRVEQMAGGFRDGIVAYNPVDRLLVLDSHVQGADLGLSCNTGPCAYWWIENTTIEGRATGSGNSGADAIAIENGRQIAIVNSTVQGATGDGIDTKASDVVVHGCRIYDVERNGIKMWQGGDVINTVIDGSGADAAYVGDQAGHYRLLHVLVTNHAPTQSGYVAWFGYDNPGGTWQIEVVNSVFFNNSTGGLFAPTTTGLSIRQTLFPTTGKLIDLPGTSYQTSELSSFDGTANGTRNITGNPMFTNQADHDYSTAPASPVRDKGETIDGLNSDITGAARVRGDAPDLGPVESN